LQTTSNTKQSRPPQTVAIMYGFSEGPGLANAFTDALEKAGFQVIADVMQADIIVAHSGGCYLVPEDSRAGLVILLGATFWPGRPLFIRAMQKIWRDSASHWQAGQFGAWGKKLFWHSTYFWCMPRNVAMWRHQDPKTWPKLAGKRVVHIRYTDDAFCGPAIATSGLLPNATFVNLSGQHDELWRHPEQTVAVIRKNS